MASIRILGKVPFRAQPYWPEPWDYFPIKNGGLNADAKWMEWYYRTARFKLEWTFNLDPAYSATGATTYAREVELPYVITHGPLELPNGRPERAWLWPGADQEPLPAFGGPGGTYRHAPTWYKLFGRSADDVFSATEIITQISVMGLQALQEGVLSSFPYADWPKPERHFSHTGGAGGWLPIQPTIRVACRMNYRFAASPPGSYWDGAIYVQTPDPLHYFPGGTFNRQYFGDATFGGEDCDMWAIDLPTFLSVPSIGVVSGGAAVVAPSSWHEYKTSARMDPCWWADTGLPRRDYHREGD